MKIAWDNAARSVVCAGRVLKVTDRPIVPGADASFVQDFDIVFLTGHEGQPAGLLVGLHGPLPRGSATRRNISAPNFIGRLAVVGNPKLSRITAGDPEVVISSCRRSNVSADALAVI